LCSPEGEISFYDCSGELTSSRLLPDFPLRIEV
jgi:hypothetical protein